MKSSRVVILSVILACSLPGLTSAYLDPGSASIIFQSMIAGAIGLAYVLRAKLKSVFSKVFSANKR
jgi:hypothetical protein